MTKTAQKPVQQTYKNLLIRRATIDDAYDIQQLYYDYLGTHKDYNPQGILKSIKTDNIYVAVADNDKIIGTMASAKIFDCIDWEIEREKGIIFICGGNSLAIGDKHIIFDNGVTHEIRGLCVDIAYRHQGIATALLEQALSETQTRSYAFVWAPGGEVRAKELWKTHGFMLQEIVKDIGTAVPAFCEQCMERKNGCTYCECHVYVEDEESAI